MTTEQIEKEAEEQAMDIWPYENGETQRAYIKLGYMRAMNKHWDEVVKPIEVPFSKNQFKNR